ncbi:MAG: ribonuclease HI family protein [Deltaproteobacteria bacterium]|nr:ribonuclease HI family protein [Deltaproteobacteria bacterium]
MKKLILYTDGAARGNPGPASAGAFICTPAGDMVAEISEYLGETTNNVAEYQALLAGLKRLIELGADEVEIRADSELMVRQMEGRYRVKHPNLKPLYQEALTLLKKIPRYSIKHVRREENKEADRLANRALDER